VPARALLARSALAVLVLVAAAFAAVGGVSLGGAGLVAVALAAVVAGCLAAAVTRDGDQPQTRQTTVDVVWRTAVGTVAGLLVLSGCAVVAGGALTALLAAVVVGAVVTGWLVRAARRPRGAAVVRLPQAGAAGPVRSLSVEELGREWLRTSAALAQARGPVVRQVLVERRQQALDELERRDPAGFTRWLAEGATVDSDPARYVSEEGTGDPTAGYDAA
jgi:hypothetical protein